MTASSPQSQEPALFKPLTLALMLVIGIVCFGAFLTLSGFADNLKKDNNGRAHAVSKSPNGFAGLVRLLKADGMDLEILRGDPPFWDKDSTVVYTIPSPYVADSLDELTAPGAQVFVLPKWRVGADSRNKGRYIKHGTYNLSGLEDIFQYWDEDASVQRKTIEPFNSFDFTVLGAQANEDAASNSNAQIEIPVQTAPALSQRSITPSSFKRIEKLQTFTSDRFIPILGDENGIILGKLQDEPLYVLADPDFWNNYGIYDYDVAVLAQEIAEYVNGYNQTLYFDLNLHGLGSKQNFLKTMLSPPFLAATLCLLFTGGLLGWSALTQFGAPRRTGRTYALGKAALADNSAELIKVAGREPKLAARYTALTRNNAAKKIGAPRGLSEAQLITALDKIGKRSGTEESISGLTKRADKISQNASLMALARALYKWKQEITHDRK